MILPPAGVRRSARPLRVAAGSLLAAALVPLAGCVSSSDIDGLRAQIAEVQRQVLQIQLQTSSKEEVAQLQQNLRAQTDQLLKAEADMRVDLGALSNQISELQGQLEDTNYRLAQVSQQIASTNQDLRAARGTTPPASPGDPAATAPAPGAADPESLYQTSYSDYLRGNYELALIGFRQYLEAFPDTDLADNASYWIGECFYRQQKYAEAIAEYDQVLARWTRSDKTASAQLKRGYAQIELGQRKEGIAQLQKVVRDFPSSDEANLARQRLQSLGVASTAPNR